MPANDSYWRNLKTMHVVFAVSSAFLLIAFLWMMAADHADEFRDYQRIGFRLEAKKFAEKEARALSPEYEAQLKALEQRLVAANEELDAQGAELERLRDQEAELQQEVSVTSQKLRDQKAFQNKFAADRDLAVAEGAPEERLQELTAKFEEQGEVIELTTLELQGLETELADTTEQLKSMTAERDAVEKELKDARAEIVQAREAREKLQPESNLQAFKRWTMELPIIDGFNSHIKPTQDWLPNLPITLGMTQTARFDRCRTCHMNIDAVEAGNVAKYPHGNIAMHDAHGDDPHENIDEWLAENKFPHPYSTHPNVDLYTTASSPHPVNKFGCTICHEGNGSATSFSHAQHMPSNPVTHHEWEEEYDFHVNHYWEYPMHTNRFVESSCIKCHHDVTELGSHPEWGASAPKVVKGYETIKTFGCFGCHEMHGYEGDKAIGPDLRLEPPTRQEAFFAARRRIGLLPEDEPNDIQLDQIEQLIPKITEADAAHPGKMRKVGPALTHIASKTTRGWLELWTRNPKDFRPTTKMPRFYDLSNQHDEMAENLQPVEIAGIAQYLLSHSRPFNIDQPADDYERDADRGKELFAKKGCLACHSQSGEDYEGIQQNFGPELSRIHEKVKPGEEGYNWLYTWLKNPNKYHARTRMPILYLDPYEENGETIDPAADIAAYLLEKREDGESVEQFQPNKVDPKALDKLVRLHLNGKALTNSQVDRLLGTDDEAGTRDYPIDRRKVIGDEVELTLPHDEVPTPEQWTDMQLSYVGKRTIARYGCYGCHSIPGFEDARPIGVALQDWGRKDPHKLAFEHVEEYLHHHGMDGADSTTERVSRALKRAASGEFEDPRERAEEMDVAYFYEQILDHGRPGFIWQKLREPRSYDFEKTETKRWDERLRMPKFTFAQDDREDDAAREAIITFVLGLVAEPPPSEYIYDPTPEERSIIEGEKLLTKYNCTGCHALEMDTHVFAADWSDLKTSFQDLDEMYAGAKADRNEYHVEALDLLLKTFKPPTTVDPTQTVPLTIDDETEEAVVVRFQGLHNQMPDPEEYIEDQFYSLSTWNTLQYKDPETGKLKLLLPNKTISYNVRRDLGTEPGRGGEFAKWLVGHLAEEVTNGNRKPVWQVVPPPLVSEGRKVQTPWLYQFLLEPHPIRPMTVLRMPKFNMSPDEAQKLANYFAAIDGVPYPYQDIVPKDPEYLDARAEQFDLASSTEYTHEAWKILNANQCNKCHAVGNRQVGKSSGNEAIKVQGPNLEHAAGRLRPEYTQFWIYRPEWMLPYTGMTVVYPNGRETDLKKLFGGDPTKSNIALRDALMNYHNLMERYPNTVYTPGGGQEVTTGDEATSEESEGPAPADRKEGEQAVTTPKPTEEDETGPPEDTGPEEDPEPNAPADPDGRENGTNDE